MLWIHRVRPWHTHTQTHARTHAHSQQSCSASTPCNPSDKLQRLLLLLFSPPPPPSLHSASSCNWIWIKMAFPFLLYSSLLWLKRDLPGEITRKHTRSHTHVLARSWTASRCWRCVLCKKKEEKNIFTNKQALPASTTSPHSPHSPAACTIVTSSIARGHQPLLPSLVFHRSTSSSLPHTLSLRP